jgi:hypothetical protein
VATVVAVGGRSRPTTATVPVGATVRESSFPFGLSTRTSAALKDAAPIAGSDAAATTRQSTTTTSTDARRVRRLPTRRNRARSTLIADIVRIGTIGSYRFVVVSDG